jgi:hypothetical protein
LTKFQGRCKSPSSTKTNRKKNQNRKPTYIMQNENSGLAAFDPNTVDPSQSDTIPNGWYDCQIVSAEEKPCKGAGGNMRLNIGFKIIGEQFTNRQFFSGLNYKHTNALTQEIAQRDLSAICHATGVMSFANAGPEQFIGKALQVKVGVGKVTAAYPDPQNEGKGYKAIEGAQPGAQTAPPAFAGAQPAALPPAAPVAGQAPPFDQPAATIPPAQPGAVPSAPDAPTTPPATPPAPPLAVAAPPVAVNPLEAAAADGWLPNPNGPGWYYNASGEQLVEADLAAKYAVATPPVAPAAPAPPVAPAQPAAAPATAGGVPAAATGAAPAWATQ